jgi:hypothetical protein
MFIELASVANLKAIALDEGLQVARVAVPKKS